MKLKLLFVLVFVASFFNNFAQEKKEVLFTIDDKSYYTDEFIRIYKKNLDLVKDESQKDLNQYLELFIGYKLKINKALKLGLDKNDKYITELKSNRTQLAKAYVTDSKVTQQLIDEAYLRMKKEIRASHILLMIDENATPEDTLKAYNSILDIRKRAIAGENFGKLAQENSQDTSAKENKGDLGYFSAFRMVYPFESGAFNTKKGEISTPVRTRFGYHIINVVDIRDNRGEVNVAHIMVMKVADSIKDLEAKNKIFDIYKKINQGEKFEVLAQQFSEDKSSSEKGGVLNKFGSGQLSSNEFEDVAFSLNKEKAMSVPFQSQYGWHIVKFIERYPVKSATEMQQELSTKIGKDERSRIITKSVNEKLRKEYSVKKANKTLDEVTKTVTSEFVAGTWKPVLDSKFATQNLLTIDKKNIDVKSFLEYLQNQQRGFKDSKLSVKNIVDLNYIKFEEEQLNLYNDQNLESKFPAFANVMEEYRDGLLLFDLMEKEIWEKAKTDSIGLKAFYDKNKQNYKWKTRLDLDIANSNKPEIVNRVEQLLKDKKSADEIKKTINTDKAVEIMINSAIFEEGNTTIPKNVTNNVGVTEVTKIGEYSFVTRVNKVIAASEKTLEEANGRVINDYQQFLEENWVSALKKEFVIKVNQPNFEKTKKLILK